MRNPNRLAALAITFAAGVMRFWQLGNRDLWYDELVSVDLASKGPLMAVVQTASRDLQPPLFVFLQSLISPLLGNSEWAVRVLPASMGVLTTYVIYLIGKKVFDARTGLWAAALFAVAPIALHYGQEARPYAQLMLASSLVLLAFIALMEKPTTARTVLLGLALATLAYTHVYGLFTVPLVLAAVLVVPQWRQRVGKRMVLAYHMAGIAFIPWALVVLEQAKSLKQQSATGQWWLQAPSGEPLHRTVYNNFVAFAPRVDATVGMLFVTFMAIGVLGYVVVRRTPMAEQASERTAVEPREFAWLLLAFAVVPVITGIVVAKQVVPIYNIRYTLAALPPAYLLAAAGGVRVPRRVGEVALALLLAFGIAGVPSFYRDTLDKGEWRSATTYVMRHHDDQTAILADGITSMDINLYGRLLGRTEDFEQILVQANPSDETSVAAMAWVGVWQPVDIDAYMNDHARVIGIFEQLDHPFFAYMQRQDGWRSAATWKKDGTARIQVWEKLSVAATTTATIATATPTP